MLLFTIRFVDISSHCFSRVNSPMVDKWLATTGRVSMYNHPEYVRPVCGGKERSDVEVVAKFKEAAAAAVALAR